jgi:hypothetical protein
MTTSSPRPNDARLPTLGELGDDLLGVTVFRRLLTLAAPFAWIAGYLHFAYEREWTAAVGCVMGLNFISYRNYALEKARHVASTVAFVTTNSTATPVSREIWMAAS